MNPSQVHLLPAVCYQAHDRRNVPMERLTVGDVIFLAPLGARFLVASIGTAYNVTPFPRAPWVLESTRDATLVNVVTGARKIHQFRNVGHGTEHVEGRAS